MVSQKVNVSLWLREEGYNTHQLNVNKDTIIAEVDILLRYLLPNHVLTVSIGVAITVNCRCTT
jgi:hypothetical protein